MGGSGLPGEEGELVDAAVAQDASPLGSVFKNVWNCGSSRYLFLKSHYFETNLSKVADNSESVLSPFESVSRSHS